MKHLSGRPLIIFFLIEVFLNSYAIAETKFDASPLCVPAKVKNMFVGDCQGELGAVRMLDSASSGREAPSNASEHEEHRCRCLANGFPVEKFAKPPTCRVPYDVVQAFLRNPNGKLRCK